MEEEGDLQRRLRVGCISILWRSRGGSLSRLGRLQKRLQGRRNLFVIWIEGRSRANLGIGGEVNTGS